jgi:peptidoglycan/xylan/chitin deacetylase (PgdA/CDA1 family)
MNGLARRVGTLLLRSSGLSGALRTLAAYRGRRLVLVYHRLSPEAGSANEVIPTVPVDVFRQQLRTIREAVDLVTLDELLAERRRAGAIIQHRPAVAITFDDDLPSHCQYALPVLRELDVPATFFLSGRTLHGLGPYCFQELEALLIAHGLTQTVALLGVSASLVADLVVACARSATLRRRVRDLAGKIAHTETLDRGDISALVRGGMSVGFHTTDHPVLTDLEASALATAVTHGREALAAAAGTVVRHFAYPYGKADLRSAAAVRRAGFVAAFTGAAQPIRRGDDRYLLGRWEPGPISGDELLHRLAVRLHRQQRRPAANAIPWM